MPQKTAKIIDLIRKVSNLLNREISANKEMEPHDRAFLVEALITLAVFYEIKTPPAAIKETIDELRDKGR